MELQFFKLFNSIFKQKNTKKKILKEEKDIF